MTTDNEHVEATVYLQVAPEYKRWYGTTQRDTVDAVEGAKVVNSTQTKSVKPKPGTVEVKLTIRLPKAAFVALHPEAVIVIPESMTQPHPVEVEAIDPEAAPDEDE